MYEWIYEVFECSNIGDKGWSPATKIQLWFTVTNEIWPEFWTGSVHDQKTIVTNIMTIA